MKYRSINSAQNLQKKNKNFRHDLLYTLTFCDIIYVRGYKFKLTTSMTERKYEAHENAVEIGDNNSIDTILHKKLADVIL